MKSYFISLFSLFILLFSISLSFGQLNMTLQDSMNYNVGVNDVCGWVAPDGREYALVGLNTGVSIVDINSDTIHEVAFVPGVDNLWRDINTFGHYAYVSSEAHIGLLIIDLQYLPDSVHYHSWFGICHTPSGDQIFQKAHSLNIDENGILFLNGSNLNSGGCVLVDVKTDPENPICLGYSAASYSHDCIARDSILYSAEIFAGNASIYDIHDINNITLLGQVKTPHEFTHNISLSADGKYMFTTDERPNSYVTSYDISDRSNIKELDRFRQAAVEGNGAIVHNVFTWQDWLVLAYYSSGTLIVDASRPGNLVEVGNFDSFIGADGGYEGVWGAYTNLPSGKILASDRSSGLFVFIPNYVRAAFLEGTVVDSITGLPISGATVKITSNEIVLPQTTILDGTFKTGKAVPGTFPIIVTKEGYYTKTILLDFANGNVLTPVIKLSRKPTYNFSGRVITSPNAGLPQAKVWISGPEGTYITTTDQNGYFLMPSVYAGTYEVQAGVWGLTVESQIVLDAPKDVTLLVQKGYKDDFDLNLGWQVVANASEGNWMRGVPTGQLLFDMWQCGSTTDSPYDIGPNVYSTGLSPNPDAGLDEVSGGTTKLISPLMLLDSLAAPKLSFDYWLCEFPPNQYQGFSVWLASGPDTILIKEFASDTTVGIGSWQRFETSLTLPHAATYARVLFIATDTTSGASDYYLKVHVDNFEVTGLAVGTHDEVATSKHFTFYPNPNRGSDIYLKPENGIEGNELTLKICDAEGRMISLYELSKSDAEKGIHHHLEDGFYFMQWNTDKGESGVEKVIILN
ncbi:MAG: choice-of-anchor B family protein [Saprospiraceae bacterium]